VTVTTTFVTPEKTVWVVVVVTLWVESSIEVIVVASAVDQTVEVAHLAVSSSVTVTVLLSRPRFSTWALARRASRAARNSARLSATCLLASRRRREPPVDDAAGEEVSRAAAKTTVGVILAQGSW
jgi:hypothetical protein